MAGLRITLVPHTHWDREWYEPFDRFRERLVAMMDALLDLADAGFPHFHLDGQTAVADDYLAVRPEREADLRRHAAAGRLSLGPWVTQMDEFLVSGESLLRNLERGLRRGDELGGALRVGYLPDQFGHIGQMPQLLRAFGIQRAVVWRGVPRAVDRTAFWWEAPDGSRVLAEYLAFGYALGWQVPETRDGRELAALLRDTATRLAPLLADRRILVMVGSDHAGPDPELPRKVEEARAHLPDVELRVGSLEDHLAADPPPRLPAWRGELRSAARAHLLTGVYSTRIHQKRERARVEALLERYAEPLAALVPGVPWPAEELDRAWTLLLWNGAHDSACGCSHDRVARDVDARHAEARAIGEAVVARALAALGSQVAPAGVLRFNPSPFEREGVPGLGWRVEPPGRARPRPEEPVPLRLEGAGLHADGVPLALEDEADVGDLYNFCPSGESQTAASPRWTLGPGPGEAEAVFDDRLRVRLRAWRRPGEPFLGLEGVVANARPDHRLRLVVGLPAEARGSVAGSPFELVARPLVSEGGEVEAPSRTWPARGVVLAGGMAVLAEGVVEYEVLGDRLAVTLLRCVGTISRRHLATRPFPAGPGVPTPEAQMIGETGFALGLLPGAGEPDLLPAWERFALPLRVAPAAGGGRLPPAGSLLELEGAQLSAVRRVPALADLAVRTGLAEDAGPTEALWGADHVDLVVFGAHRTGQPLHHEVARSGARLLGAVSTAPAYRMARLATTPPKPGVWRSDADGASIVGERWAFPRAGFADFVSGLAAPMAIGVVELADGSSVLGFLCEPRAIEDAEDVTGFGDWLAVPRLPVVESQS